MGFYFFDMGSLHTLHAITGQNRMLHTAVETYDGRSLHFVA